MTDFYALLDIPRRADLDRDAARAAFQRAGAAFHPDASTDQTDRMLRELKFQELQEAYAVLGSAPKRLKHLTKLLQPESTARGGVLDETLMHLFSAVHEALQLADALLMKKQSVTSALAKALLAGDSLEVEEKLETQAAALMARQKLLNQRLADWDQTFPQMISVLENAAQEAAFLEKWEQQIQQRRLQLVD